MFDLKAVKIAFESEKSATRKFKGQQSRTGTQYMFSVSDHNFYARRDWTFEVFLPKDFKKPGSYLIVQPAAIPNRRDWATLKNSSLLFSPLSNVKYRGKCYAKLALADSTGERNKFYLTKDKKGLLFKSYPWLTRFRPKPKGTVTKTKGSDADVYVALVDINDFPQMIRLFLTLKPWVISKDRKPHNRAKISRNITLHNKTLKGLTLAITGFLGMGKRKDAIELLRKRGAIVRKKVSNKIDIILKGYHYLEEDRVKIREAERLGIEQWEEKHFCKKYNI